jgi:hypothetical protein
MAPPDMDEVRAADVPTLERLLGSTPLRETSAAAEPSFAAAAMGNSGLEALGGHTRATEQAAATPPGGGGNVILDAFNALLAMEQGEPRPAARVHAPAAPAVVTDELVAEVTRRVLERLAPNAARDLVRQVVSEVAERLVREEIARIKTAAQTKR